MTTAFAWIGFAFCLACAITALLWTYEKLMNGIWKRCIDSHDFYVVVCRYAEERKKKRDANRVGFSDE